MGFVIVAHFWDIESGRMDLDKRGRGNRPQLVKERYKAPSVPNLEERKREAWRVYRQFGD